MRWQSAAETAGSLLDSNLEPTPRSGQFDVLVDGELIASRGGNPVTRILLGAGFPDSDEVVAAIATRRG